MKEYYVLCLRHTFRNDFCLEWWLGRSGYTYNLDSAWKITKDEPYSEDFFDGQHGDIAVPVELVDSMAESHQYNGDGWTDIRLVQNTNEVLEVLGIKRSRLLKQNSGCRNNNSRYFRKFDPSNFKKE